GAGGPAHGDPAGCKRQPVEWAAGHLGDEQCGGRHGDRDWAGHGWRGHGGGRWLGHRHGYERGKERDLHCYVDARARRLGLGAAVGIARRLLRHAERVVEWERDHGWAVGPRDGALGRRRKGAARRYYLAARRHI